jgi:glutamyl-tRNA reductase
MFEKLFMLVKSNAGKAVIENPAILEKDRDAVMNDASSSIIEVLKNQMDSGKLKDLVKYFQYPSIYQNPLIDSAVNRFTNKLNNYYNITIEKATEIAHDLIPPVMQEMIKQSKQEEKNNDFSLSAILTKLSGNMDMTPLLQQLRIA